MGREESRKAIELVNKLEAIKESGEDPNEENKVMMAKYESDLVESSSKVQKLEKDKVEMKIRLEEQDVKLKELLKHEDKLNRYIKVEKKEKQAREILDKELVKLNEKIEPKTKLKIENLTSELDM